MGHVSFREGNVMYFIPTINLGANSHEQSFFVRFFWALVVCVSYVDLLPYLTYL